MEQRERMAEEKAKEASRRITETFFSTDFYKEAKSIFVYFSIAKEPDTSRIILQALADGKIVALPRTKPNRDMDLVPLKNAEVFNAAYSSNWPLVYGIPELPPEIPAIDPMTVDVAIVPSLAVDKYGCRLGYGGGYYDRFISRFPIEKKNRPLFVAIQYESFFKHASLPKDPHDRHVDIIITEAGLFTPVSS